MKYTAIGLLALASVALLPSCEEHNRPTEPSAKVERGEVLTATHTVDQLKALYTGRPTTISEDVIVEATMASDDTEGNLYRTAYIQDATGGIELKLSLGNLSTLYPQGSKVMLLAKGMTLGRYGGQVNLGYASTSDRYETAYYPEKLVPSVLRFQSLGSVTPKSVRISELSPSMQGQLIRLDNVQFINSEIGQTYAAPGDRANQSNVNRTLIDREGRTIIVRTSSYARFAGRALPTGSGSVTALVTYFNSTAQLLLLREGDAQLSGERF